MRLQRDLFAYEMIQNMIVSTHLIREEDPRQFFIFSCKIDMSAFRGLSKKNSCNFVCYNLRYCRQSSQKVLSISLIFICLIAQSVRKMITAFKFSANTCIFIFCSQLHISRFVKDHIFHTSINSHMSIIQKFLTNHISDDEIIIVMMPFCPTQ